MEGAHSRASVYPASRNILHKHMRAKALLMSVFNFTTCFHLYVQSVTANAKFSLELKIKDAHGNRNHFLCIANDYLCMVNNLGLACNTKCKTPMREWWPLLIASCLDKKQVNLACEGARPTSHLPRHSERTKKKKAELMWTEHEWL